MAGHSHWAGIKHKKGKQDKERAKIFANSQEKLLLRQNLVQKIQQVIRDSEQQFN